MKTAICNNLNSLKFPVVAFSPAGWQKESGDTADLTEVSPTDDLQEWKGLEIYDSLGQKYIVEKVWRTWPRQSFGVWLCKILNYGTYVDFQFSVPVYASLEELKQRLRIENPGYKEIERANSHYELIQMFV